jgi:asparaginyl-tRNA synthetase
MLAPLIKEILAETPQSQEVKINGWVRTRREMKNLVFVEVNDGSCASGIQCTFDQSGGTFTAETEAALGNISTGAAVAIEGLLVPSPASGQTVELSAKSMRIIGEAPAENREAEHE